MKIGILGAMPEEVAFLTRSMGPHRETERALRTFHEGTWRGCDIVVVRSRVGKVSAAVTTLLLLEHFGCTHILFTGVAGALSPELRVGDVVIADRLVQHDMDARPLFPRFEIPLLGCTEFPAALAPDAAAAAERYLAEEFARDVPAEVREKFGLQAPRVRTGQVVSGDQFVADPARTAALREALPDALCTEMEGAAVAQVCHELGGVPCAVIRVISDQADHAAAVDFLSFIAEAAEFMTGGIVGRMLETWSAEKEQSKTH